MTHQDQYVTDLFTDRAIDFLHNQNNRDQPFCLSVHYTAPHAPWRQEEQPPEIWQRYANREFNSVPTCPPHPWGGWDSSPEKRQETLQGYFTTITAMDAGIARILDTLDTLGITENTLVFFTSDNGYNMGHHGILGKGNGTFSMNMYEESVKVPFIARCPGIIPRGILNRNLISHYDFMPTILDYLGFDNPLADQLPGRSFAPTLHGETNEERDAVVVFDEYGPVRMIRDRDWKYIHRSPNGPHELYCLANDPGETTNLIQDPAYREKGSELREKLTDWFQRYVNPTRDGAPLPVTGNG